MVLELRLVIAMASCLSPATSTVEASFEAEVSDIVGSGARINLMLQSQCSGMLGLEFRYIAERTRCTSNTKVSIECWGRVYQHKHSFQPGFSSSLASSVLGVTTLF